MASQVLFQFLGRNLLATMRKGTGGSSNPVSARVINQRQIGTIMVEEGTNVEQIVNVQSQLFQIARQLRRPVHIPGDDVEGRNLRFAQRLFGDAPRDFVVIRTDHDERIPLELGTAGGMILDYEIQMF